MTPLDVSAFLDYVSHAATLILGLAVLAAAPHKTPNQSFALYVFATTARPLGFVVAARDEERVLTLLALDLGIAADKAYAILDEETKRSLGGASSTEAQP